MLIYTHVAEGNTVDDQDGRHDHGFDKSVNDARYRCGVFGINAPAGYEVRRELMSDDSGDRRRHLTPEDTGLVVRALLRAEAKLLLDDADTFDPTTTTRTPEQRRADALVEIATAGAKALDAA
jgi:hypothetical protein